MAPKPTCSSPYDGIKQCLTIEACSTSTIKLLNDALFAPEPIIASATVKIASRSKNARSVLQKTVTETVTLAVSSTSRTLERQKLAIEVINNCLKGLGDAAKKDTPPLSATPAEGSVPVRKTGKLVSNSAKPLQSRSANRNDTKPDSLVSLASCCGLSISYLNSIRNTPGLSELPPLQVENAQNSLLSKLIQLGMFDMGLKEAKSLKRKLSKNMQDSLVVDVEEDSQKVPAKARGAAKTTSTKLKPLGKEIASEGTVKVEKEPFSKILEFKDLVMSISAFPLAVSCQLGVLRCLAGLKKPELIEVSVPYSFRI